ncbi:TNFAIP3-interacting protein 1 [Microtus ochrogaster]|uniref:TNFAIP3-interacting protein 1 n=1 Tax=Microtus ochrogaster TaxID=79684 RepID=A0A8J6GHK9_MICOH|nr:TNFAIP3-interacting protein 1 [Microtus ochrogaster]
MEGRGPYRIYDPGGSTPLGEASAAFERLVLENTRLKGQIQGIKTLGGLLEESQMEASRLRQKAEELVKDSELPPPPPTPSLGSFDPLTELTGQDAQVQVHATATTTTTTNTTENSMEKSAPASKTPSNGTSSDFEVVPTEEQNSPPQTGSPPRNMMTLCEQLRQENEALKAKLDKGLEQRDQAAERLREENMELKKLLMNSSCKEGLCMQPSSPKTEGAGKKGIAGQQQAGVMAGKVPEVGVLGTAEKKVKILEQQRMELLEVNKQWDQHFRSMKQQYEQKTDKEQLTAEAKELRQKVKYLQDQLSPLTRHREYQEKEIQRLNKALEEALSIQASSSPPPGYGSPEGSGGHLRKQELVTQNELLKQQVKIFEEDFQRERSDRERMNEEKEELKKQVEKLQAQVTLTNVQLKALKDEEKAREALKQQKRKAKASGERYHVEPHPEHLCGAYPYAYPPMPAMVPHHTYKDWSQIRYPPPPMPMEHPPPLPNSRLYHLSEYTWRPPCAGIQNPTSQVMDPPPDRPAEPGYWLSILQVGCNEDLFLSEPRRTGSRLFGDHAQFMCVCTFCFKLSSWTCPMPSPYPSERSCGKGALLQKRTMGCSGVSMLSMAAS